MTAPAPTTRYLGIDLSSTAIRAVVVAGDGNVSERREAPLDREQLVEQVAEIVAALRAVAPHIGAVGVGIPGLVNRHTDRVVSARNFPAAVLENLHAEFMKATGLQFELENDANAAAYGEYQTGAGAGCSRSVLHVNRERNRWRDHPRR